MGADLHAFDDRETLAEGLADLIAGRLADAIAERGAASLVLSGGSTPGPLYDALALRALAWDKVIVTLNDERWVDPADPASNEHLVRTRLMVGHAAAARFVGMKTPAETPEAGLGELEARLKAVPRPFDVMLLGMGGDGHTASLFPGSAALKASLDGDEAEVQPVREEGARGASARMTLSLPAILQSRLIVLMIAGADKLEALRRAEAGEDVFEMPIRAVLERAPVQVFWAP